MPAASGDFGVALADLDINLRIVPSHLWMLDDYLRSIELLMAFILGCILPSLGVSSLDFGRLWQRRRPFPCPMRLIRMALLQLARKQVGGL
ncbi:MULTISPECIES: hypothetical protein [unclassified Bradyrhizobium]|uniref:hypothetical protein n=1 Tax=unclassified Bradyrhizobium TaxID=2631580 RepID=UPI001BCDB7CD|nr:MULTISPECIES: hypothetical protein [unclassified Bradyrhizobium]WOH52346.1 hypothetical protein RX328_09135 [Bradyrhizobium sp. sBnM-33]